MVSIIDKLGLTKFQPLRLIAHGKAQTVLSYCLPYQCSLLDNKTHIIDLIDGDKIAIIENRPPRWKPKSRIVLLIPGLAGSHLSKYMVCVANILYDQGFLVIRMNLRGCGAGQGLAKFPYHAGRSDDARAVIRWLAHRFPDSPVTQVGFSLGANITLKMAGEDAQKTAGNLDSIVAVSPPLDLYACVKLLIKKENWIFHRYFINALIKHERNLRASFPGIHKDEHKGPIKTLYDFDEAYTAPRSGFDSALDYYERCSSGQFLEGITIPTFLLHALDDPFISKQEFHRLPQNKHFEVLLTSQGGHVGWLGQTHVPFNYRWMDLVISSWIKWFDTEKERT